MNNSKNETRLHRWLKLSLGKICEVTSSNYHSFDISHLTISKVWSVVLPV